MALKALARLFGAADDRDEVRSLYAAIVAEARQPHWYVEGGVADSIDGRFDMVNAVLALVLIRLEALGEAAKAPSVRLAEAFVEDMEGQLREIGIGDQTVGKHMGRMMGALGGRLGAYRDALSSGDLGDALVRNLYRGEAPEPAALGHTKGALMDLRHALDAQSLDALLAGRLRG